MSAPENPHAFPYPERQGDGSYWFNHPGMSLRDYFAGQALIAFAAAGPDGHAPANIVAGAAFEMADAMLAARKLAA